MASVGKRTCSEKTYIYVKHIVVMMHADFVPPGSQRIRYMFYSRVSDKGGPIILERDECPETLKQSVSWSD